MNYKIYYVGIGWNPVFNNIQPDAVDKILDPLGDWIRLNDRTWLCSTEHSSQRLYQEIHRRLPALDRILIIAVDPSERFGLAPYWVWEWIDGQRQVPPKTAAAIIAGGSRAGAAQQSPVAQAGEAAEG